MRRSTQIHILLLLALRHQVRPQDFSALSELPFNELLAQKKLVRDENVTENGPVASALVGKPSQKVISSESVRELPSRKTFYEDYEEERKTIKKKKDEYKLHEILNTSIMALSYLAFAGYLLCMIAGILREKRRFNGPALNNQFVHVLQHYMSQRPTRPFIRFPAVTVHQGGKKRRRRSNRSNPRGNRQSSISSNNKCDQLRPKSRNY